MSDHKSDYSVFTLDKKPAMTHTKMATIHGTYKEAVELCHKVFHETKRSTYLASTNYESYYWHRVDSNGVTTDRNHNSGVPETQVI